jgi:hypothetical protein
MSIIVVSNIFADPNAPGQPLNFTLEPDISGALEAQLNWINPALSINGEPLTELSEICVFRNYLLIFTETFPIIGEPYSYMDSSIPDNGMYDYQVLGFNSFGTGTSAIASAWVGEDVPAAITDFILIYNPQTQTATLTWTNPTEGLHGGAFNEQILGYHLERSDGCVFEITGIQTVYIDNTIPGSEYYYYTIVPYNSVGDGGSAQSNIGWPPPVVCIIEDFSAGCPPPDWTIQGDGQENWSASPTNNAGGTAPEAMFSWTPSFDGTSRLTSYPVDTSGMDICTLLFDHYVNDYAGIFYIKVETSSDLLNWNTAWEVEVTGDIGPIQENLEIITPDVGSETFYLAFTFEGYSFDIDYWFIDEIFCLFEIDYTGFLSLNLDLIGGEGSLEEAEVEIDNQILNPDSTGNIFVELTSNLYDISATLENYFPAFENEVYISIDDTTYVDMILHFLEPPSNLEFEIIADNIELNWQAPETLLEITSYNVYRDDEFIAETSELTCIDEAISVGLHEYFITVYYDEYESGSSNIVEVNMTSNIDLLDPIKTELTAIYPNPFNPTTTISFSVAEDLLNIEITIYNLRGQKVRQLIHDQLTIDQHTIIWNGKDDSGKKVSSGIYFCRFKSDDVIQTKRILMLK